jgi:hypothetical protein
MGKRFIADNTRVIGVFKGNAVIGEVLSSRLYGKRLVYTVKLAEPIELRWRTNPVDTVLMGANEIKVAPLC